MRVFEGDVGCATLALGRSEAALVARFRYTNGLEESEGVARLLVAWLAAARASAPYCATGPRP